jgi:hypothetical protein
VIALLLCLVPQGTPAAEPPLLPPAPAGWQSERLAFPLDFAPEIELRGYEDLRFAPGMFQPGSDSYFSYALALRLEGDIVVDQPFLSRFLDDYYRGLCATVARERKLDFDPDEVEVAVRPDGPRYRARIGMIDAFVTGEPLELEIELESRSVPRATEVLGLASPLDPEAPIWTELRALADDWRAMRAAPVFLNHVYMVPDAATYEALRTCEFLRELAVFEERETVRSDGSYRGLYLYGRRTYFEFLPPGAAGLTEGASGIALGLERFNQTDGFTTQLQARGIAAEGSGIMRQLDDQQVPWFHLLGIEMPAGPLTLFSMEYAPRFLERWHPGPTPAGIARADVLARYAAVLRTVDAPAPLGDVSEVRLALDDAQRERLLAVCAVAGHEVEPGTDSWTIHGPQLRLAVQRASAPGGVTGLGLTLRSPLDREPLELGQMRLEFHGSTAELHWKR